MVLEFHSLFKLVFHLYCNISDNRILSAKMYTEFLFSSASYKRYIESVNKQVYSTFFFINFLFLFSVNNIGDSTCYVLFALVQI